MMKYMYYAALAILASLPLSPQAYAQQGAGSTVSIIPKPLSLTETGGYFQLNSKTRILVQQADQDLQAVARQLADELQQLTGLKPALGTTVAGNEKNAIILSLVNDTLGDEGYRLSVNSRQIHARGNKANGVFYATQSILQLLPVTGGPTVRIPGVEITDKPRFGWRGLMLDVGRYFYSVDYVKRYIDYLAMHKMNTFHWHLTEDHGWRIEIKKYPRLTEIGAWRPGTQFAHDKRINNNPHGGYYTQEQIREVVAYAQSKFVTIVPEIEMPGHTVAALVAYPELSCTGGPFEMLVNWGIQKDIYCAGKEQTFQFLQDVLTEVIDLFPGEIIHIGGDEAPKDRWKACPHCQKRIKDENLKDEHELQSYFITRIEKFLLTKGKRIIGWDEILEGGLAPNAAVMSWRGVKGGIEAAKMHHPVVMTPTTHLYFDYYQGEAYLEPYAIGGYLPLKKVYDYEPVPEELNATEAKYILGVQGNLWAEFIHSPDYADYMAFPRATALAEIAWTAPGLKNWEDFTRRMETQYQRYELADIRYSKSAYNVTYKVDKEADGKRARITLSTDSYQPDIRYTTDGSEPTADSPRYEQPFTVTAPSTIKAATFKDGKRVNKISNYSVIKSR